MQGDEVGTGMLPWQINPIRCAKYPNNHGECDQLLGGDTHAIRTNQLFVLAIIKHMLINRYKQQADKLIS